MHIDEEIVQIRKLLATGKLSIEIDKTLPKAPTIALIENGELHVEPVPDSGLEAVVDYDTMQLDHELSFYLISNTPSDGDYNERVTVKEVKPHTFTVPKDYIKKLHKNELALCLYFIDDKESSNWTTFIVR